MPDPPAAAPTLGFMWTRMFWQQALERAVKSAAQALIGLWALDGLNLLHAHWDIAFGIAAGAAVLSVLTSIVSVPFSAEPGSPSLVDTGTGGPPPPEHRI